LGYSFASNIAKNLLKIQSSNPLPIIISAFTIYFRAGSMLQIESGRFYYDKIKKGSNYKLEPAEEDKGALVYFPPHPNLLPPGEKGLSGDHPSPIASRLPQGSHHPSPSTFLSCPNVPVGHPSRQVIPEWAYRGSSFSFFVIPDLLRYPVFFFPGSTLSGTMAG